MFLRAIRAQKNPVFSPLKLPATEKERKRRKEGLLSTASVKGAATKMNRLALGLGFYSCGGEGGRRRGSLWFGVGTAL